MFFKQLRVTALLDYFSVGNNCDFVGVSDGGKPVRDNNCGSSARKNVKRRLNEYFGGVVEGTCGFVENENRRIFQEYARYAEPLLRTARKLDAALADLSVVAVFKRSYIIVNVGALCRLDNFLESNDEAAVKNVFLNDCVE